MGVCSARGAAVDGSRYMTWPLLKIEIKYEHDVVPARQRTRQTAQLLGFEAQDQAHIATALSELARNMFQYAVDGKVKLLVEDGDPQLFRIRVIEQEPFGEIQRQNQELLKCINVACGKKRKAGYA